MECSIESDSHSSAGSGCFPGVRRERGRERGRAVVAEVSTLEDTQSVSATREREHIGAGREILFSFHYN